MELMQLRYFETVAMTDKIAAAKFCEAFYV